MVETKTEINKPNAAALTALLAVMLAVALLASGATLATGAPGSSGSAGEPAQHRIQPGETLSSIAARYGTDVATLAELNGLSNPNLIFAGAVLLISAPASAGQVPDTTETAAEENQTENSEPALVPVSSPVTAVSDSTEPSKPSPETETQPSWTEYLIQPGDSLTRIANEYNVTIAELIQLNRISNPDLIFVGQTINIPIPAPAPAPAPAPEPPTPDATSAPNPAGTSDPSVVLVGSTQLIPAINFPLPEATTPTTPESTPTPTPTAGRFVPIRHTIKPGETLSEIAAHYGLSGHEALLESNPDLDPAAYQAGASLLIPDLTVEDLLNYWARYYEIPPELFKAMTWWESGWNNSLISSADAIGIGQLIPATVDFVSQVLIGGTAGARLDPHNQDDNIRMSARFLLYLLDQTGWERSTTLAAYYQGLGAVRSVGIYNSSWRYISGILGLQQQFK